MRILIPTNEYPPHIFGGIGTFCYALSNALAAAGVHVTVVAGCPPGEIRKNARNSETPSSNLEVIRVPRTTMLPPSHLWYQLMNLSTLRDMASDFDVVHGQDPSAFPLISFCKTSHASPPWVVTLHSGAPFSELHSLMDSAKAGQLSFREFIAYVAGYPLWDSSIRAHVKHADRLVAVSKSLMEEIRTDYSVGRTPFTCIHTGIEIDKLESLAKRTKRVPQDSGSDNLRLFVAGRFYWRKGILHLLRSIAYLVNQLRFDRFRLEIFGRGPLESTIRRDISLLNLSNYVVMRGFAPYEEVMASLVSSNVVCFPSLYEACPLGMVESMALGKPVATFDRPFSRELLGIGPESKLPKTIEEYAKKLHSLCKSEDSRNTLGQRLKERARKEFDIKIIADKYSRLYRDMI